MTDQETAPTPSEIYGTAAGQLANSVETLVKQLNLGQAIVLGAVVAEAKRLLGDGRNVRWRARVRLYSATDDFKEPVADSDPELPSDNPGTEILPGLAAVADYLAQLAALYHNTPLCVGLDTATLDHRLKSLRPTISRRGGNAAWRVPYHTVEHIGEREITREWLGRVDIERVEE